MIVNVGSLHMYPDVYNYNIVFILIFWLSASHSFVCAL